MLLVAYPETFSDTAIMVWEPKLGAQIKGELMQNNISHLIISSTQMHQQVLRHLGKILKNVELKTCVCLGLQLNSV